VHDSRHHFVINFRAGFTLVALISWFLPQQFESAPGYPAEKRAANDQL
jgi:hypothetical protein